MSLPQQEYNYIWEHISCIYTKLVVNMSLLDLQAFFGHVFLAYKSKPFARRIVSKETNENNLAS